MENKDKPKFAQSKIIYRFGKITKIAADNTYWQFQPLNSEGEVVGNEIRIYPPYKASLPAEVKVDDVVSFKCRYAIYPDKNNDTEGHASNSFYSDLWVY